MLTTDPQHSKTHAYSHFPRTFESVGVGPPLQTVVAFFSKSLKFNSSLSSFCQLQYFPIDHPNPNCMPVECILHVRTKYYLALRVTIRD